MPRIQSVLIPILAGVVSLASVSCACAAPAPEPASGPAPHHAHHQDAGVAEDTECVDSGCGGNGGFDAVLPERAAVCALVEETSFDDGSDVAPALAGPPARPFVIRTHQPPPTVPWLASVTPVSRFDILLN